MKKLARSGKKGWMIFFDFDNTLTPFDVLDKVIERFAVDDRWKVFEQAWQSGKIGSRECLEGQLESVRVVRKTLSEYLAGVPVDPAFSRLLVLLKQKGIDFMIVSDSFTYLIQEILRHNGVVEPIKIYANRLRFQKDRLIPSFPFASKDCARCAHCKKRHVLKNKGKMTVYVGDGLSDICPAEQADLVFAKAALLDVFKNNKKPCVPFKNLANVAAFFEELELLSSLREKAPALV